MKKRLLILSILTSVLAFQSCQKCQRCTTTTSQNSTGTEQTSSTFEDYCGDDYNNAPTETSYSETSGGTNYTITIDCQDQ